MEIANDITSLVGNTPLVKLERIRKHFDCYPEIIAKLESFNPSASVKDRIAYSMLDAAEKDGIIINRSNSFLLIVNSLPIFVNPGLDNL